MSLEGSASPARADASACNMHTWVKGQHPVQQVNGQGGSRREVLLHICGCKKGRWAAGHEGWVMDSARCCQVCRHMQRRAQRAVGWAVAAGRWPAATQPKNRVMLEAALAMLWKVPHGGRAPAIHQTHSISWSNPPCLGK